jgi:hypothetical protein
LFENGVNVPSCCTCNAGHVCSLFG